MKVDQAAKPDCKAKSQALQPGLRGVYIMKRRPAVTLMEVLIAMFIMAIGMMALLVLFPVGAVSMAQALKDDRCAYASYVSENVAIATNVRNQDANVNAAFLAAGALPTSGALQSGLVFVDPYGVQAMPSVAPYGTPLGLFGVSPGIPRVYPTIVTLAGVLTPRLTDRWFSLQDDITFNQSGTPDTITTGGIIDRGRAYSYAFLLRRQPPLAYSNNPFPTSMYSVHLDAVVYKNRPVVSMLPETTLPAVGAANTNGIVVTGIGTTMKRGGWILDTSYSGPATGLINGYFYRVTNLTENPATGTTTVEVQQNLLAPVTQITIMDYVAEVFDKGYGWQQ
jgi:hypothetical protein